MGTGRMGSLIEALAKEAGDNVVAMIDKDNVTLLDTLPRADVLIDFSNPQAWPYVKRFLERTGTAHVNGTTGYDPQTLDQVKHMGAVCASVWSANYSLGVAAAKQLARLASQILQDFDIEIVETHHRQKVDAPSGTANLLLEAVNADGHLTPVYGRQGESKRQANEIGMHSLRGGTVAGEHTVFFFGPDEEVRITHRADNRKIFAAGALRAAHKIATLPKGDYTFDDLLNR